MLKKEELDAIKSCGSLCELDSWWDENGELREPTINGVELDYEDFGEKEDVCPSRAEPYGCGNMKFLPFKKVKEETLHKYNITEEEYRQIQKKLDCLSFGNCGWCI